MLKSATRSDHCPAMKGIETSRWSNLRPSSRRSDHCPAMKGIETTHFVQTALN